jgi:hypothetical protein
LKTDKEEIRGLKCQRKEDQEEDRPEKRKEFYFLVFKNCAKSIFTSYIRQFGEIFKNNRNNKNN